MLGFKTPSILKHVASDASKLASGDTSSISNSATLAELGLGAEQEEGSSAGQSVLGNAGLLDTLGAFADGGSDLAALSDLGSTGFVNGFDPGQVAGDSVRDLTSWVEEAEAGVAAGVGAAYAAGTGCETRGMTAEERSWAEEFFGDSLDLDKIVFDFYWHDVPTLELPGGGTIEARRILGQRPPGNVPFASGNVVHWSRNQLVDPQDITVFAPHIITGIMMHELTHCWQYQNSDNDFAYAAESVTLQVLAKSKVYGGFTDFARAHGPHPGHWIDPEADHATPLQMSGGVGWVGWCPWEDWTVEHQAQAVEAFSKATHRLAQREGEAPAWHGCDEDDSSEYLTEADLSCASGPEEMDAAGESDLNSATGLVRSQEVDRETVRLLEPWLGQGGALEQGQGAVRTTLGQPFRKGGVMDHLM